MDGKVFQKETKSKIVKMIDDAVKLPFWAEPFDGAAARAIVNYIDSQGDKHIPDTFDSAIDNAVNLALDGNYEEAAAKAGAVIDENLDIKYLPDDVEALLFVDGARFIVRFVQNWIEKKKKDS
jgi:hypothetical protein